MDKQTGKLIARIAENLPEMEGDIMQGWIDKPKKLQKFLLGLCPAEVAPAPKEETPLDTIIRVDRNVCPVYTDWMKEVMHPELEKVGPSEYDISKVELWLHDGQKNGGWVKGNLIYTHLKETNGLKDSLGLLDLEEIRKKGIAFFRKYFKSKAVFGWKSVVRYRNGNLNVPYLCEGGGKVILLWHWLENVWFDNNPALRLASST